MGTRLITSNTVSCYPPLSYLFGTDGDLVLGYGFKSVKSLLANRRTHITLTDASGKVIEAQHPKTADDTIFVQGTLSTGIPVSLTLRGGAPFKDTPGLIWSIYGTKGEIRVTASGPFLQIGYPDLKIEVHDLDTDTVEVVSPEDKEDLAELPLPGRNVGRVYKALEKGVSNCSFEDAVERHTLIEGLYKENGYNEA